MTPSHPATRRSFLGQTIAIGASSIVGPQFADNWLRAAEATRGGPGPWQIGCFTRPWAEHDYRVALDAIAEAGFRFAGLMTQTPRNGGLVISAATTTEQAQKIGQEAKQRGLGIPCVYGGDFPVAESLAAGVAGLRRLVDACAAAEAAALMVGGTGDAKLVDAYYRAVAEVCDYAAERRVGIVLKPHGGLNATGPQCRQTIASVGHKSFTLWYDPGNIFYYSDGKLNPVDDAPSVAGLVSGMCVKDFAMTTDGDKVAKDVALTPGTGKVDFPKVLAALRKGGFTSGPLLIECLAPGPLPTLLDEAKKAREFVEGLARS